MQEDYNRLSLTQVLPEKHVSEEVIKVFISYSRDSKEHEDKVYHLAQALRDDGVGCTIDRFVQSPDNWDRWMLDQVDESDFVLIICTQRYYRRYRGKEEANKGLGVTWESTLIMSRIYDAQGKNNKFYPIFFDAPDRRIIPDGIRTTFYDLSGHDLLNLDNDENRLIVNGGYQELYRLLTKQPAFIPKKLGSLKKLETVDREIEQQTEHKVRKLSPSPSHSCSLHNSEDSFDALIQWISVKTRFLEDLEPTYEDKIFRALKKAETQQTDFSQQEIEIFYLLMAYRRFSNGLSVGLERFKYIRREEDFLAYLQGMINTGERIRCTHLKLSSLVRDKKVSTLIENLES